MLLDGRSRAFACELLDIGCNSDRVDRTQFQSPGLAPLAELPDGLSVRLAGVAVADRCREEFDEATNRIVAGPSNQIRQLGEPNCENVAPRRQGIAAFLFVCLPHFRTHNVLYDTLLTPCSARNLGTFICG